tara:strand:- start:1275 stop:1460 length:186 start_codon:yes stop_codon:yes gene_type:complete
MKCWHCGTKLIWGNDFDFEDYGYDGEGIVSVFSCPNEKCNAEVEVRLPANKKKVKNGRTYK